MGGAEVSAPSLRCAQHNDFEYKQKQDLGSLGGRTYVKVVDEGDDEPPYAVPAPRKRWKLKHDLKVGQAVVTLDQRTLDDLCAQVHGSP